MEWCVIHVEGAMRMRRSRTFSLEGGEIEDERVTVERHGNYAWSMHDRPLFVTIKTLDMPTFFLAQRSPPNTLLPSSTSISLANPLWSLPPHFLLSSPSSPWSQQLQLTWSSKNAMYSFHLYSYQTQLQSGSVVLSKLLSGELFLSSRRMRIRFLVASVLLMTYTWSVHNIGMSAIRQNK